MWILNPSPTFIFGAHEGNAGDPIRSARQSNDAAASIAFTNFVSRASSASTTPLRGVGPGRKTLGLVSRLGLSRLPAMSPPTNDGFHSRVGAPASWGALRM